MEEPAFLCDLPVKWMLRQKSGLHIGHDLHAMCTKMLGQPLRGGDLTPIPVEHTAALADLSIAAGEIEAAGLQLFTLALFHKAPEPPVAVRGVGVLHGAAAVVKGPVRHASHAAAKGDEGLEDLPCASQKQIEDQVFFFKPD